MNELRCISLSNNQRSPRSHTIRHSQYVACGVAQTNIYVDLIRPRYLGRPAPRFLSGLHGTSEKFSVVLETKNICSFVETPTGIFVRSLHLWIVALPKRLSPIIGDKSNHTFKNICCKQQVLANGTLNRRHTPIATLVCTSYLTSIRNSHFNHTVNICIYLTIAHNILGFARVVFRSIHFLIRSVGRLLNTRRKQREILFNCTCTLCRIDLFIIVITIT